jgi:hypothetical protein
MNKIKSILLLLLFSTAGFAANDRPELKVTSIPDSLKKNAYAVVRFSYIEFDYKSISSATEKHSIAVTIFDKKGSDAASFRCSGDKFEKLTDFSGQLYDAEGKILRKYKMSDISSTEYSSELASDARYYGMEPDLPSLPVTILYEYETSIKNGILVFPLFYPQDDYNLSVEKASFKLIMPDKTEILSKAINMSSEPEIMSNKGIMIQTWKVQNLKAIDSEKFSPSLSSMTPKFYSNPKKFEYDNVPGEISSWETMGKWQFDLNKERDILTPAAKSKIIELTKEAKSDKEKVHILYDYLGKTTRYVSIQLGIGGLQPMLASEVCRTGFGDCKGLSNYLKAMLEVVGIPSNYTVICLDQNKKSLFKDYANFYQTNHVILQVPLPNDTLWLECTNPRVPFGFTHNGISGHDALVNVEAGGKLYHLPDYPDSLNIEKNVANVVLNEDGSAKVNMQKKCLVKIYDNYDWFPLAKSNEQADNLREDIKLPSVTMGSVAVREDKSQLPGLYIDYSWNTPLFGSKTGNRLFVPTNPFRNSYDGLKKSKRVLDIHISAGYKDIDSIFVVVPDGFEIESLPASTSVKTEFGTFSSNINSLAKGILIQHSLLIPSGDYKATAYPDFVAFFEKVNSHYKSKIILRKKTS